MNNNNMYYGQNQGLGYAPQKPVKYTQPLTVEQVRQMKKGGSKAFTMEFTDEENLRAICTHKDPEKGNQFSLVENEDGTQSCYICGSRFNLVNYSKEEVIAATDVMNDILNTIKTYYLTIPEQVATNFMTVGIYINRIPQLYDIALNDFNQQDTGQLHNQYNVNPFAMFNSIMSPGTMSPQGNMMGMGQGAPMGMPQGQMGYSQPQMGGNPFGGYDMNQQMMTGGYNQQQAPYGQQQPNMTAPNQPNIPQQPNQQCEQSQQQQGQNKPSTGSGNVSSGIFNV